MSAQLPETGRFPLSTLAAMLEMDPSTLRRWVKKFNCPFKQPGDEMFLDAGDLWESWPYCEPEKTPKRSGGKRKGGTP